METEFLWHQEMASMFFVFLLRAWEAQKKTIKKEHLVQLDEIVSRMIKNIAENPDSQYHILVTFFTPYSRNWH